MFATWVGIDPTTNEHVVVIGAIRARTVPRRLASGKWNADAVKVMQAFARVQNPENQRQAKAMPERR